MSANQIVFPPSRAYNRDDTFIEFATNLVDVDTAAVVNIDISNGPTVGQELALEWAGKTAAFTVASTINAAGTAWPVKSGLETLEAYATRIYNLLLSREIITSSWRVIFVGDVSGSQRIQLIYRIPVTLAVTVTEDLANVAVNAIDGTDGLLEPNLSCLVQVWAANPLADDDTLLGTLQSPYDIRTGTTQFNLKNYVPVGVHLPAANSIAPGIISTWPHGEATNALTQYYYRFNDKFGTPAVPLALLTSGRYYMLHGSLSADSVPVAAPDGAIPLHCHRRRDGGEFEKWLSNGMPDYAYLFADEQLEACNVRHLVVWSDGTTTTHNFGGSAFDLEVNKAHWIRSTPISINYAPPSAGALPLYITFQLFGDIGGGEETLLEIKYKVASPQDWQYWILFDNGVGGCETALFLGKATMGLNITREIARRPRSSDFDPSVAELFAAGVEAQRTLSLNSGYLERYQIEHLQQLLLGDCWLIDGANERFIRLVCDSSQVSVAQDDNTLFNLEASFRLAFIDTAINV